MTFTVTLHSAVVVGSHIVDTAAEEKSIFQRKDFFFEKLYEPQWHMVIFPLQVEFSTGDATSVSGTTNPFKRRQKLVLWQ